jgi:hypothetical protein
VLCVSCEVDVQDTDGPAGALVMRLSDFRVPIVGIRCA